MQFANRADAGRALAEHLLSYAARSDVVVLAIPRGGVVVGCEIARALAVALDIYLVRKLGAPGREELAMGAIASDGTRVLNASLISRLGISDQEIASTALQEGRDWSAASAPIEVIGRPWTCGGGR